MLLSLVVFLGACGSELDQRPTTVPPSPDATASPAGPTVGTLADRIAAAWAEVDRYQAVTVTAARGTPVGDAPGTEIVDEVILPNTRRQVVTTDGVVQSEIVATGGSIYGRGPNLPGISQPNRDPTVWITINGNVLGSDNSYSGFYQSLLLPAQPPYSGLDASDRARPVEPLNEAEIDGQRCERYQVSDTTLTGAAVTVTIALTAEGLVCSIETASGESVTVTRYRYDLPATIDLPASPVQAPAENG